jgi:hypothetical protein
MKALYLLPLLLVGCYRAPIVPYPYYIDRVQHVGVPYPVFTQFPGNTQIIQQFPQYPVQVPQAQAPAQPQVKPQNNTCPPCNYKQYDDKLKQYMEK